jgi:hypothetical protein
MTLPTFVVVGLLAVAQQVPPPPSLPMPPRAPAAPPRIEPGAGVISGTVVSDETPPRPVRTVRVTLNMTGRAGFPGKTVTTDDLGRFQFDGLPAGRFNIQANRPNYVRMNYGARRPDRPGTPVPIAEGEQKSGLVITMPRGGVITGTIRDASGAPVSGATVTTLSFNYSVLTGQRQLVTETSGARSRTDDRGVYRSWGLAAGEFVIAVQPPVEAIDLGVEETRALGAADIDRVLAEARRGNAMTSAAAASTDRQAPGEPVRYTAIYYPGTPELASAQTVKIAAGEERDGVDVQLQMVRTARIAGAVRFPEGAPAGPLNLTLAPIFVPGQAVMSQPARPATATAGRDGAFSFGGVAPGRYTVIVKSSGSPAWWSTADIAVDGRDQDVGLELRPPLSVRGRFVFEGSTEPPKTFGGTRMFLQPPSAGSMISQSDGGEVGDDGRFEIRGVIPDVYFWGQLNGTATGAFASWSLKSVTANGRDASDGALEVRPNESVEMIFTLHDRPSELAGTLQDASGRAASDYFVVVFPTDKTRWAQRSRRVQVLRPGTDGQFSTRGLPAGEYYIGALTDLANGEQNDPALLESLVPASLKITLSDGEKTTQDLRLAGR